MKSPIVLLKLCKENHRVQSKILNVSFSTDFRFETKIGYFVTKVCTYVAFVHTFSQFTMTQDLLWKGPHIPMSNFVFVITMVLMNAFICPYSVLNITVIAVCFYYFISFFKFQARN